MIPIVSIFVLGYNLIQGVITMNLGERIKLYRQQFGLTQELLAKKAGISRIALGNYERGERTPPVDIFAKIASALHTSMDELYGFNLPTRWEWLKKKLETNGFDIEHSISYKGYVIVLESIPEFGAHPLTKAPKEIQDFYLKCEKNLSDIEPHIIGNWFYIENEDILVNLISSMEQSIYFSMMKKELYLKALFQYSHNQLIESQSIPTNLDNKS